MKKFLKIVALFLLFLSVSIIAGNYGKKHPPRWEPKEVVIYQDIPELYADTAVTIIDGQGKRMSGKFFLTDPSNDKNHWQKVTIRNDGKIANGFKVQIFTKTNELFEFSVEPQQISNESWNMYLLRDDQCYWVIKLTSGSYRTASLRKDEPCVPKETKP